MSLFLIAAAGLLLAVTAESSMNEALSALDARNHFQAHWSILSVRRAILDRGDRLITLEEERVGNSVGSIRLAFELNGKEIEFLVADENAKANINTMWQISEKKATEVLNSRFAGALSLRPLEESPKTPRFQSWGQALTVDGMSLEQLSQLTSDLTCWGDGTLHIHRASDEAIDLICYSLLGKRDTAKLLALRRKRPSAKSHELLSMLGLDNDTYSIAAQAFGDSSRCFSLTILPKNVDGGNEWRRQYVYGSNRLGTSVFCFRW